MNLPNYEMLALKYATRSALRRDNVLGDQHDESSMPEDYFVWVIRNGDSVILVDTGFDPEVAARRQRTLLLLPKDGLKMLGIDANAIQTVVITHLHHDHVGTFADFPNAVFHLQEQEMAFATGRYMCFHRFRRSFESDHIVGMVKLLFAGRVRFHAGDADLAPGISLHRVGGHTPGMQVVRVHTARGWVVLASDATHYYEHFEKNLIFPSVFNVGEVLDGYEVLRKLADSPKHVIPGHDPLVMERYPAASSSLNEVAVRLDLSPLY